MMISLTSRGVAINQLREVELSLFADGLSVSDKDCVNIMWNITNQFPCITCIQDSIGYIYSIAHDIILIGSPGN